MDASILRKLGDPHHCGGDLLDRFDLDLCGALISALGSIATFVGRMVRPPPLVMPFSPLMAARIIAPTILDHAGRFLVAIMILSEIAVLLQQKHPQVESKLIAVLAGINQGLETYGLVLVSIATISLGLSLVWLSGI